MNTAAIDCLVLDADTAADLMTPNPVSVPHDAALRDAIALFTDREISAAPVIDDAGRPVGVVSRTDIVRSMRQNGSPKSGPAEHGPSTDAKAIDIAPIRDIMTPAVLSVSPSASVIEVVSMLLGVGRVHQLYVIDETGVLVGVLSALDILRKLKKWSA